MDSSLRSSMLHYYDERAPDYEEAYVLGTGTSSIPNPDVFRTEASLLGGIVERFAHGRLIDLACGMAYWLPRYVTQCSTVTLFDQSEQMLNEARKKTAALGSEGRSLFVRGDFFQSDFSGSTYDCALAGFFLSHLTESEEARLFGTVRQLLNQSGRFMILDSAWSPERAQFNSKVERQERKLNDGTSFEIYKRYCDLQDIRGWEGKYGLTTSVEYFGTAFFAVSGCFLA